MVCFLGYKAKGKPLGGQGEALCTRGTQGRPPPILLAVFPLHFLSPNLQPSPDQCYKHKSGFWTFDMGTAGEGVFVTISFDLFNCLLYI